MRLNQLQYVARSRGWRIRENKAAVLYADQHVARPNIIQTACLISGVIAIHPMDDDSFDESDILNNPRY